MNLDERFGELRSVMHSLHGEARWQAVCAMLHDWPEQEHLQQTIIPYLQGLFAHDATTLRVAPDAWWSWGAGGELIRQDAALKLATGISWAVEDAQHVATQLTHLRRAGLSCHHLSWNDALPPLLELLHDDALARLRSLELFCYGYWGSPESSAALERAPLLAHLTHLQIDECRLAHDDASALARSPLLKNLTTLALRGNHITTLGARELVCSPLLNNLTALDLRGNQLRGPGAALIARSPCLTRLTTINLERNQIDDEGAAAFARACRLNHITALNLSHNAIGDGAMDVLARSSPLATLTTLELRSNQIGDAGAAALARSPHLANLITLDLIDNPIGDEGAQALASSPYLNDTIRQQWRRAR